MESLGRSADSGRQASLQNKKQQRKGVAGDRQSPLRCLSQFSPYLSPAGGLVFVASDYGNFSWLDDDTGSLPLDQGSSFLIVN